MSSIETAKSVWGIEALRSSREARRRFQDRIAPERDRWIEANRYYYERIKRLLKFIVEPQKRVLELRCQTGDLLAAVQPRYGVGVEISQDLVALAQAKYPEFRGVRDLWGDYELILGASKLHLEIVEMPVHYQERVYGVTKMTKVFSNGVRMLWICRGAWRKLNG